jgi:hypothetical protein
VSREETRKRLYEDFEYYAKHCLKLRSKPDKDTGVSKLSPFLLNRGQKRILENVEAQLKRRGFVRLILVKGRQMGSSTFVEGWLFWWTTQRKAQRTLVVAHDATATQTVFEMTKRFFDNCPEAIRPHKEYNSRKELSFDKLDSSYRIATAGGDGIVRGEMIQTAHLSEFAWWPPNSAKQNFSGLMDAIPNTRGTAVFIESTSNSYNLFYEQYEAARKGESLFEVVFLPWYWADEYQMPVGDDFELTPDETELMAKYGPDGLTHGAPGVPPREDRGEGPGPVQAGVPVRRRRVVPDLGPPGVQPGTRARHARAEARADRPQDPNQPHMGGQPSW